MMHRNGEYAARITAVRVNGSVTATEPYIGDLANVTYDAQAEPWEADGIFVTGAAPAHRRAFNNGVNAIAAAVGHPCWIRARDGVYELIVIEGGYAEDCASSQVSVLGRVAGFVRNLTVG